MPGRDRGGALGGPNPASAEREMQAGRQVNIASGDRSTYSQPLESWGSHSPGDVPDGGGYGGSGREYGGGGGGGGNYRGDASGHGGVAAVLDRKACLQVCFITGMEGPFRSCVAVQCEFSVIAIGE